MFRRSTIIIAALCTSVCAHAQEEEEGPWAGTVSLGYLGTTGNTESTSYNAATEVSYTANKWKHTFSASAIGAETSDPTTAEDSTTAEAYNASLRSDYSFNEHDFLFGLLDWRKDRFSGFDQQISATLGYGRRLVNTDKHNLNATIGLGYRTSDLADGTTEDETIGRAGLDYTWHLTETSEFGQDLTVEYGSSNTYVESVSALRAEVLGELALVLSYTVRHNTDPPPLSEETDTFTAISLEYAF
jgi:putative salt-induced outer membrane protein